MPKSGDQLLEPLPQIHLDLSDRFDTKGHGQNGPSVSLRSDCRHCRTRRLSRPRSLATAAGSWRWKPFTPGSMRRSGIATVDRRPGWGSSEATVNAGSPLPAPGRGGLVVEHGVRSAIAFGRSLPVPPRAVGRDERSTPRQTPSAAPKAEGPRPPPAAMNSGRQILGLLPPQPPRRRPISTAFDPPSVTSTVSPTPPHPCHSPAFPPPHSSQPIYGSTRVAFEDAPACCAGSDTGLGLGEGFVEPG